MIAPEVAELARAIGREVGREIAEAFATVLATPAPGLLPPEELAAALRVSQKTVLRLAKEGLPAHRVGGLPRYDLAEVKAWLKSREGAEPVVETPPRRLGRGGR